MTDRIKLAEELEAAEGPSRELDARIALYVLAKHGCALDYTPEKALQELPNLCMEYTSSIDAAMTLVPEGWHPSVIIRQGVDACIMATSGGSADFTKHLPRFIASAALKAERAG